VVSYVLPFKTSAGSEVFYYNSSILSRKDIRTYIIKIELEIEHVIMANKPKSCKRRHHPHPALPPRGRVRVGGKGPKQYFRKFLYTF